MEDRELLKKLNNLKDIRPDNEWKKNYREILYSQISAGQTANQPESNISIIWENIRPGKILMDLAKPVWLTSLASVLILLVGIGGVYASKNSKPGDSLYIAKIISEKAQSAMAFNEKDKAKLGLEFATNRAKEMTQVLKDSAQTTGANNEKLEKLSQNFKKEISQVKNRLTTIMPSGNKDEKNNQAAKDDELQVFSANLGKNDQRMEIAEPVKSVADQMLEEAEKMFDEKNYDGTIDKLGQVNQVISQAAENTEPGQVKGQSETATSTQ
jgi:hypothetical protein